LQEDNKITGYRIEEENGNLSGTSIQKFVELLKKYSKNKIE
jgi:hypothetical protein